LFMGATIRAQVHAFHIMPQARFEKVMLNG
jgi:hypothetical protein